MSLLPASIKRIGSKTTEKRWRHHFPHYKSLGAFCRHGNQSFDPIFPQTLCSLSLTPIMLHIKFDQVWPTGFRNIQVQKCEIFFTQGLVTPKWVVWFGTKSNSTALLCLSWLPSILMIIRSKKNEIAWRQHFPITLGKSFNRSPRNFDILGKQTIVWTIPLFQAKVMYNRGNFPKYHFDLSVSRICITIQR